MTPSLNRPVPCVKLISSPGLLLEDFEKNSGSWFYRRLRQFKSHPGEGPEDELACASLYTAVSTKVVPHKRKSERDNAD